jgi:perosamine synthetase
MINIYEPYLNKKNLLFAHDALDSTWISSHGKYLNIIKDDLITLNGSKYVLLCNNGTTATHLMAIGLKYKNPNIKNIIVPNNVYVAAWNSFLMNPFFNLIPIDSNLETWNIDYDELEKTTKKYSHEDTAILIVHNIGNIVNVPLLKKKYPDYIFLEDNCEGFLGEYNTFKSGSKSLMSSVSFFGNKTITCGEGGALFTDDEEIFEYLNSVRTQGSTSRKFIFDKLGYNYRMTNIQAAILKGQIDDINIIKEKKQKLFDLYKKQLSDTVKFQKIEDNTKHSNWMLGVRLDMDVDKLSLELYKQGVETRPMFSTISEHHHLKEFSDMDNEANSKILSKNCIILPSHPNLQKGDINYICNLIKNNIKS